MLFPFTTLHLLTIPPKSLSILQETFLLVPPISSARFWKELSHSRSSSCPFLLDPPQSSPNLRFFWRGCCGVGSSELSFRHSAMQLRNACLVALLFAALASGVVNIPLQGDIPNDGEFWAPLGLGTPAQNFKLQIDTGSADLLVYSVGCTGCGTNIATFDPKASSSDRRVLCNDPIYNCAQSGCSGQYCNFDDQYAETSLLVYSPPSTKILSSFFFSLFLLHC